MTITLEACRHFLSFRLGSWEVFAQRKGSPFYTRETDRPFALVTVRDGFGAFCEAIIEAPGFNLHLIHRP